MPYLEEFNGTDTVPATTGTPLYDFWGFRLFKESHIRQTGAGEWDTCYSPIFKAALSERDHQLALQRGWTHVDLYNPEIYDPQNGPRRETLLLGQVPHPVAEFQKAFLEHWMQERYNPGVKTAGVTT